MALDLMLILFPNGEIRKNFIVGADLRFLRIIDNRRKDTLIFGEDSTQGLDDAIILVDAKHYVITRSRKFFCSSLLYNGGNSFLC